MNRHRRTAQGSEGRWGPGDLRDLTGATALVTGANSGIGFETALELAAHGALVVLACRDPGKAHEACHRISVHVPQASVEPLTVDLAEQASVADAADRFCRRHDRLDILVNNAGVMGTPLWRTEDGFELQLATNHLGPFALTGRLAPLWLTTTGSRVVTVSSHLHRLGHFDWDDLASERRYHPWDAYGRSKLANLWFTFELDRRLRAAGSTSLAVAAHPGWAATHLVANGPAIGARGFRRRSAAVASHLGQSAAGGAVPVLYAATAPGVAGGDYYGPGGPLELMGSVGPARVARRARDEHQAARLWASSETLTGVSYDLAPPDAVAGETTHPAPAAPRPDG